VHSPPPQRVPLGDSDKGLDPNEFETGSNGKAQATPVTTCAHVHRYKGTYTTLCAVHKLWHCTRTKPAAVLLAHAVVIGIRCGDQTPY
jgi:hypothetical protein